MPYAKTFNTCSFVSILLAVAILAQPAMAGDVPGVVNYQGLLTDAEGGPVTSGAGEPVDIQVSIFDAASGGSLLWSETHAGVDVQRGRFRLVLGSVVPFPQDLWGGNSLYLELVVNTETLTPRQRITSAVYSLRAGQAGSVADGAVTAAKLGEPCAEGQVLIKTSSGWGCGDAPYIP